MPANIHLKNRGRMPTWDDHKQAVRQTLKRQRKTVYWLHSQLPPGTSRTLVYDYCRKGSKAGISVENMERINRILGIRYTDE